MTTISIARARKRYEKYNKLGGIDNALHRLQSGKDSFTSIGRAIDFSAETVRQDILKYIGAAEYAKLKSQKQQEYSPVEIDLSGAIELLKKWQKSANGGEALKFECIVQTLSEARRHGVPLMAVTIIHRRKKDTRITFKLADGRKVLVRPVFVLGGLSEHRIGLHRMRPPKVKADFVIFGLCAKRNTTNYVFGLNEIERLKSLVLRFDKFDKKSKYDYARERWGMLI